ncbi:unnamed protein product [Rotaria sordida]|uniref:Uncharacterized protein n=1 Tax=Rotaria sordida TaxID=392033 RepID=A0A819Y3K6_9BILA|nr:unnamed protein product [Rotaria sordida]
MILYNENLNFKLNINKNLSDLSNETDLLEDLFRKRLAYSYKENLQLSNKLAQVYQNEINQLSQIHSTKELNAIFSSYTNPTLFYFLSNIDENLDRLGLKLNKFDFEFEEISNFSLIKIKDLYRTAIIKVLFDEQERRKQIRLEKLTKNENEEIHLTNLIQQDEEREKQLLEKIAKTQEEIFKVESDLNKIIGQMTQSEEIYKKQIENLEQERKKILSELNDLNEELDKLSKDMINNEKEIRKIKQKVEDLNTQSQNVGPLNGQLVSELGINIKGDPIQVKKYKISVSGNVSYRGIHQNLKDTIEREIKCQNGGLFFDEEYLKVIANGINSLDDLPKEIKSVIVDRIKIDYQQHEWEDRLNRKYEKAVQQLNELKIDYKKIVGCYVDQIEILCGGIFLLDSNDYYPGIDLIIRAKRMKSSDGSKKRTYRDIPEGHSGYVGEFGRDGQHAGNIFIKIDETIENLENLESVELSGGKGSSGQLGGSGDRGHKGKDGENGKAEDTRGFAGGQTTFGFGQPGTHSGDGGNAGFSGRGGKGGQPGKLTISDNQGDRFEQIKDRIQQKEGLAGEDPDLSSSTASKGGEGGEPTIVGMDQVRNKKSFIRKTTTENGEIDIPYLLEKNPELRETIEKNEDFGYRGLPTYVSVTFVLVAPIIIAPLPLLIDGTIPYRMSKNEEQYRLNPRRDKNTKGKSKENETSRFRQETERESETIKRDFSDTSNLDRSLLEKCKKVSENIKENDYEQIVNQLKIEEQTINSKIADYQV